MIDMNERTLVKHLRTIGKLQVDAQAANHTIDRLRATLTAQSRYGRSRWWLGRVIIPTGMAAAVLLVLVWTQFATQPATAAERLREAGLATRQYRGWVHETSKIIGPSGTDSPVGGEVRANTETGKWVNVLRFVDRWKATMRSPRTREQSIYRSHTNTLTITPVDERTAQHWANSARKAPWTIDAALDATKKYGIEKQLVVSERQDGNLNRFDIIFPKDNPTAAQAQHRSEWPLNATVWVDPQTKLIRRFDIRTTELRAKGEISYGPPAIKDLYDVGVPRSAKVVKDRPTSQNGS